MRRLAWSVVGFILPWIAIIMLTEVKMSLMDCFVASLCIGFANVIGYFEGLTRDNP